MKVIAYYLPQFHEIKENNEWWGQGFTEWTNLLKSEPLYKGHKQPVKPLNDNYYNLLNKEIVQWQSDLSKKYNIYGFCYYHYWFSGRKILEKPAENLLRWSDIDKKFCFCWANHSWKKTWNGTMEMLIEQSYGDEKEWEEHFNYLLPFFKDDRYIKIENKPVFMIYLCQDVKDLDNRIKFYDSKCKEHGFDGVFLLESINNANFGPVSQNSSGIVLREPNIGITYNRSLSKKVMHKLKSNFKKNYLLKPMLYDFDDVCEKSLNYARSINVNKRVFLGSYTGWDSTPRHGRRGYVISNGSIVKFSKYLTEQRNIIIDGKRDEYIFMNAWNEWTEGMYLEPDNYIEYGLLETIKEISLKSNQY